MKNISFDNPYLLLLIIPLILLIVIPYLVVRNKDNRSLGWLLSLGLHILIAATVTLAAAGLTTTGVMTKTTVYALCDLSYSTDRSHGEIDAYIKEIEESLPENSSLGVVCFGRDYSILTAPGRELKSVSEAEVDEGGTDIAGALTYTAGLFKGDTLKRIILITDGNDNESESTSSIAQAVENITESGVRVDAIFLDTSLKEGEEELQLLSAEHSETAYLSGESEARFMVRASESIDTVLSLYVRPLDEGGMPIGEYELISEKLIITDSGVNTVRLPLECDAVGTFEYKAVVSSDGDLSEHNNERTFIQRVVGNKKILLVTGSHADEALLRAAYGESADIDAYTVYGGSSVPVTIGEMIGYDEIVISNLDIRSVKNANAFIDTVSTAVSKYGKSLITLGNLELHTNSEDATFKKFEELLPLDFGATGVDGRLYTIVLDASDSMFYADKFNIAKDAAIKLLSIVEDDDYVSLVTFAGTINVKPPKRAGEYKDELIDHINGLGTSHGTDIGLGLEEALAAVRTLNRAHNQVMLISDGFSFDNERRAADVAADLAAEGATLSAINTFILHQGTSGTAFIKNVLAAADQSQNYYEISTVDQVSGVVFGDMAEDLADVIVEKDSKINIAKPNDPILKGLTDLKAVSGYVLSVAKYDAVTPLTVTYLKGNNYQETVTLYAYRSHGNGRVASLATSLTGAWSGNFSDAERAALLSNIIASNTPSERIDRPFTVTSTQSGTEAYFELHPAKLDPSASAEMRITYPNGRVATRSMTDDGSKYFARLDTETVGIYRITMTYKCDTGSYSYTTTTEVAYLPEYDMFTGADRYNVFRFMRDNGEVTEGEIPDMENKESEITTYRQSYIVPLLVAAAVMFLIDVSLRKLRKKKKTGGTVRKEKA